MALLGVAALLVGCPPATGRRRGPTYDGGWGPPPPTWDSGTSWPVDASDPCAFIVPEGYCEPAVEGLACLAEIPCDRTIAYTECTCSRNRWVCGTPVCGDGGTGDGSVEPPPSCPPGAMVVAGGACEERYEGLFCGGGEVTDCDGSRRALSCACVSGQWYCDTPACGGP